MSTTEPHRVWTVAEAKARLSEILRLAEEEGPQRIGRTPAVHRGAGEGVAGSSRPPRKPLGQWLVENTCHEGVNLEAPDRSSNRPIPFIDDEDE